MKTIGLIGGMSWESSIEYYRLINEITKAKLGGLHSAKSIMVSVDFAEIEILQHEGRWDEAAQRLINAAKSLESSGADFIVICTNTMHKVAKEIQDLHPNSAFAYCGWDRTKSQRSGHPKNRIVGNALHDGRRVLQRQAHQKLRLGCSCSKCAGARDRSSRDLR